MTRLRVHKLKTFTSITLILFSRVFIQFQIPHYKIIKLFGLRPAFRFMRQSFEIWN